MTQPNLHSITDPDTRRVVREALKHGWEYRGTTGATHHCIEHISTGTKLTFASSPGVASWKSLATDIERISGRGAVWRKGQRKPSRKNFTHTGFTSTMRTPTQASWGQALDDAREQYVQMWERMKRQGYVSQPMHHKMLCMERLLRENHQPCPIADARWLSEYEDRSAPIDARWGKLRELH